MARDCWTCTNDSRATLVSSIYGLVVGVIWAVLALLALLTIRCKLPSLDDSLLFLLYFFNPQCKWAVPPWLEALQPGWPAGVDAVEGGGGESGDPEARPAVFRTQALAASRFSLASARAIVSIALLVAERRQSQQRKEGRPVTSFFAIYFGWLLVILLDCVLDAIVFSIYATDIAHSKNAHNVFRLLGVSVLEWGSASLPSWVSDAPAGPPVLMAVVGARLAPFFWIAEGVVAARVAAAARHIQQWNNRKPSRLGKRTQALGSTQAAAEAGRGATGPGSGSRDPLATSRPAPFRPAPFRPAPFRPAPAQADPARPAAVAVEENPAQVAGAVEVDVTTAEVHQWEDDTAPAAAAAGHSTLTKRQGREVKESTFELTE